VLTATLPPPGQSARPVDLFEPLTDAAFDYGAVTQGKSGDGQPIRELPAGSVWHLHVDAGWDDWELVGLFSFDPTLTTFRVPLERLGIAGGETRWAYEFWSGQFLGTIPGKRSNAGGYAHPGDYQDLSTGASPGLLEIAFFGPGVKLIALRKPRPHPWVVGTGFHQGCGTELEGVAWDAERRTLSGAVRRPVGETGIVAIAPAGLAPVSAEASGRPVRPREGAFGSLLLPVTMETGTAFWAVTFENRRESGKVEKER
jgi:hypothetical protein